MIDATDELMYVYQFPGKSFNQNFEVKGKHEIREIPEILQSYCEITDNGYGRLFHPFFKCPHPIVSIGLPIEKIIAKKLSIYEKYVKDRKFFNALLVVERPFRPQYFFLLEAHGKIGEGYRNDIRYWKLLNWLWIDTEWPSQQIYYWYGFFERERSNRIGIMERADRVALSRMNRNLTIYRGLSAKTKPVAGKFIRNGFSWTLNPEKAAWFACRFCRNNESRLSQKRKFKKTK